MSLRVRIGDWIRGLWRQKAWLLVLFLYKLAESAILSAINEAVASLVPTLGPLAGQLLPLVPTLSMAAVAVAVIVIHVHAYRETRPTSKTPIEIDPQYSDVVLRRWERFSGRTAELVDRVAAAA